MTEQNEINPEDNEHEESPQGNTDPRLGKRTVFWVLGITGLYLLVGYAWFFDVLFEGSISPYALGIWRHLWNWFWALGLFFIVPIFLCKKWNVPRQAIGMHKGKFKAGLILVAIASVVVILIPLQFIQDPSLASEYPLARPLVEEEPFYWWAILLWEIGYVFLYYIPYETFWRGFATVMLVKKGGYKPITAILFTTTLTTIIHWNKPISEIIGALAVGFIYGYLAIKLDSYYYGLVNHAQVGVAGDITSTLISIGMI